MKQCLTFSPIVSKVDLDFDEESFEKAYFAVREEENAAVGIASNSFIEMKIPNIEKESSKPLVIHAAPERVPLSIPTIKFSI
jgi:hypothetical protein